MNQGYYTQPALSDTHVVFLSDDDLWSVAREGGSAQRLTSNRGHISSPSFSPDGKKLAFISTETAIEPDIYVMSASGGEAERLTWLGASRITGWKDNETLYFTSGIEGYPRREVHVYELNINTRDFKKIEVGPASYYYQGKGFQVLSRNSGDPARWKRYQGGTAGVVWSQQGSGKFQQILKNIKTNIGRPEVIGKNIYFITDFEGVSNIYTCDLSGKNIKRLTNHTEYYCRSLNSFDQSLVYQCGAEIYIYDLKLNKEQKVDIDCATGAIQAMPRYENWLKNFQYASLNSHASELALVSRGHLFTMPPYSGSVKEMDREKDVRYTNPCYNFDNTKLMVAASQGENDESLFVFDLQTGKKTPIFEKSKWGKIWEIKSSPKADLFALVNNKSEVYILDLKKHTIKAIEKNENERPAEFDWSPDGRYLVYKSAIDQRRTGIRIYDTQKSNLRYLLNPVCADFSPSFDPEGQYLYFLSVRDFAPVYNETHFDLGFPFAVKPFVVSLKSGTLNPFEMPLQNPKAPIKDKDKKDSKEKEELKIEIDFDGIESRVLPFKLDKGGYSKVMAIKGGILYWKQKVEGNVTWEPENKPALYTYKFDEAKEVLFQANTAFAALNSAASHVLMLTDSKLRLVETKSKPTDEKQVGKKDGFVDTARVKLKVDPRLEWQQMYREAWVLQKEHFWTKNISKIDWEMIYERYLKLLKKVKTRAEFSDLMWEMQGELGTSHCYEQRGDYNRFGAGISLGRLGAYFSFDVKTKSYKIERILKGDSWGNGTESPLTAMGVYLKEGDRILEVDGFDFQKASDLYEFLENKVKVSVELTVQRKGKSTTEHVLVRPNASLSAPLYREWVEKNKKYVHEMSKGKLGYVHVPDMGPAGYAEFYRHFIAECAYEGVVVDVRFNGGGHISQHLLKVLAQKILGFDETRRQGVWKYPMYAPGVLVALANEYSGSDGDIFPHCFKLMKLGKLIGKRTWGGVIGINGQYTLRDGTWVTQPEYSFWFKDNEWHVENHGVDPDIEVEITPEDYRAKKDPQLDRAIKEALTDLKNNPGPKFKPSYYPDLSIPNKLQKLNR